MRWVNELAFAGKKGTRNHEKRTASNVVKDALLPFLSRRKRARSSCSLRASPISIITSAIVFGLFYSPEFRWLLFPFNLSCVCLKTEYTQRAYLSQISHDITQRPTYEREKVFKLERVGMNANLSHCYSFNFRIFILHEENEAKRKTKLQNLHHDGNYFYHQYMLRRGLVWACSMIGEAKHWQQKRSLIWCVFFREFRCDLRSIFGLFEYLDIC